MNCGTELRDVALYNLRHPPPPKPYFPRVREKLEDGVGAGVKINATAHSSRRAGMKVICT